MQYIMHYDFELSKHLNQHYFRLIILLILISIIDIFLIQIVITKYFSNLFKLLYMNYHLSSQHDAKESNPKDLEYSNQLSKN